MATFGYIRVSSVEQASDDRSSLDTQRRKIEAIAALGDLKIARIFEEPGVSGGKALAERPAGAEMIAALKPGDTVIISKLDRGFRNAADALATAEEWKKRGVDLIVADMGPEPVTQNGVSRMFFGMLALVAEFERERMKERLAEGREGKRSKGGHIGGQAPFGYRVEGRGKNARLIPVPEQQKALDDMRALKAEGMSLRAIATEIDQRHGFKVSHMAVQTALRASD